MAGGWLRRYSNPDKPLKRTPIERVRLYAYPAFFVGCATIATVWFWQQFVFNDTIKEKNRDSQDLFSSAKSQETLDKLRKINDESKK